MPTSATPTTATPTRQKAAFDFLSFISNSNNSNQIPPNGFTMEEAPAQTTTATTTDLDAGGLKKYGQEVTTTFSNDNATPVVAEANKTAPPTRQHSNNRLFSQREQAAISFLGQISSFSDQLGFMMPEQHSLHQQLQSDTEFGLQQLIGNSAAGGLTSTPTNVSAVDLLASAAAPVAYTTNATTLPMAIPQSNITSPGTHQRGYQNNTNLSNSSPLAAMTTSHLWSNEEGASGDQRPMNTSGIMLVDTPLSYENSSGIRNSLYKSPALARKSMNRLSNKSARSSEISLIDPLYVFTYPGGPLTLFSMMPLVKHEAKKRANATGFASESSRAGGRGMGKGIISGPNNSPYYNSFSPYLEKMGLTTITFDVKLQRKKIAESFALLLEPQGLLEQAPVPELSTYDPYYLDHPDLRTGKNKTVITLPCFLGSILQPATASELKKELNQHFKEAHPGLDSTITLSHIRGLKASLCKIGFARDLEPSSIAFAHVYLEKLILKNVVNKINKKLIASCCLLLAVKVNDAKDINYSMLVESMEKEMEVPRRDIYATEFVVYTELEFGLFLPFWEVGPHISRVEGMMADIRAGL